MKVVIKRFLLLSLMTVLVVVVSAQNPDKRQKRTPEEIAQKQTEMMTKQLELSPEQQVAVNDLNLTYAKAAQEKRAEAQKKKEASDQRREASRGAMKAQMDAKDVELKKILTSDQYLKWQDVRKNAAQKAKDRQKK